MKKTKSTKAAFDIQEMDRKRISNDLHDISLQNLSYLIYRLELATMYMDQDIDKAKKEIAFISQGINDVIDEIRNIIFNLRPMVFDDLGLKQAIERLFDKSRENCSLSLKCNIDEIHLEDENIIFGIFRIIQECIYNACIHSKGKHLQVTVKNCEESVEVTVEDDGVGFHVEEEKKKENHYGLFLIEERVTAYSGKIKITSSPGNGTKIFVSLPKVLT